MWTIFFPIPGWRRWTFHTVSHGRHIITEDLCTGWLTVDQWDTGHGGVSRGMWRGMERGMGRGCENCNSLDAVWLDTSLLRTSVLDDLLLTSGVPDMGVWVGVWKGVWGGVWELQLTWCCLEDTSLLRTSVLDDLLLTSGVPDLGVWAGVMGRGERTTTYSMLSASADIGEVVVEAGLTGAGSAPLCRGWAGGTWRWTASCSPPPEGSSPAWRRPPPCTGGGVVRRRGWCAMPPQYML